MWGGGMVWEYKNKIKTQNACFKEIIREGGQVVNKLATRSSLNF